MSSTDGKIFEKNKEKRKTSFRLIKDGKGEAVCEGESEDGNTV